SRPRWRRWRTVVQSRQHGQAGNLRTRPDQGIHHAGTDHVHERAALPEPGRRVLPHGLRGAQDRQPARRRDARSEEAAADRRVDQADPPPGGGHGHGDGRQGHRAGQRGGAEAVLMAKDASTRIRREMAELAAEIERHNYLYYVKDAPVIPDSEFDRLLRRLTELELEHPELAAADSPTRRVGARADTGFAEVAHEIPMLSLANAFDDDEVAEFDERIRRRLEIDEIEYVAEPTLAGLATSL